jgi:hypothetical protein
MFERIGVGWRFVAGEVDDVNVVVDGIGKKNENHRRQCVVDFPQATTVVREGIAAAVFHLLFEASYSCAFRIENYEID